MNFYGRSTIRKKQNYTSFKRSLPMVKLTLVLITAIILQTNAFGYDQIILSKQSESFKQTQKQLTVTGKVTDQNGEALPGVVVKVKNTNTTSQTNVEGKYSIKVSDENAILVFSYLGFKTTERKIGNQSIIDVQLSENYTNLNEVVVVGYGTQAKSEITGSASSIKADQLDQFAGGSINTSLQGKIAGLQITTNSGEPGAGANITLRGVSSINGASQPLFIIDGIPVNNDTFESLNDGASFSPLNDINPADIASIEVLKDAGTASIYGSRASNGVILITTKTGTSTKPTINLAYNSSFVDITRKIGVLNATQFRSANYDAAINATGLPPTRIPLYDSLHPYYRDSYDYQDIMYRETFQQKLDLSVSGTSKEKNVDYFISAGYRDLAPIVIETQYKQVFGNAKVNYNISKFIKGSTNFNLSNFNYNRQDNSIIFRYLGSFPVYSPYDPITGNIIPLFESSRPNPLAQALYMTNDIKRWRILGKQEFTATLLKGLDFRTNISLDYSSTESFFYNPPILSTNLSAQSIFSDYRPEMRSSIVNENTLTYKKTIKKKHNFNFLLGQSYQIFKTNSTFVRGIGNIDNQITSISGSASISTFNQSMQENVLLSYFTRANYNYKSKYLFSFLMRRDGSSRFGTANQNSYFPSVSGGWRFSEEKWSKKLGWLYDGKLRASYGITGNQNIANYASKGSLGRAGSYLGEVSITADALGNADLRWETTKQLDIGTDLSFFKGRLNFTADYYTKNSNDLLFNVQIPTQTGYSFIPFNFGSLSNKGVELSVDGVVIDKAFKWSSTVTFGLNRNKVTALPGNEDYRPTNFSLARVGEAVGVFYGFKALGIYARDEDNVYIDANGQISQYKRGSADGDVYKGGDVIFEDINNDGIIDIDDQQIIGNPTPKAFGGFQNTFSYKRFTLNLFINAVFGNDVFNDLNRRLDGNQFDVNYSTKQLRRWRQQGDVTDVPRLERGDRMRNYSVSSLFVEDGSFIRVQNVALSYNLPPKAIKNIGLNAANLGFSVQNLFTFGSYTGYDPEVSAGNNPLGFGVDNGSFPRTRSYNLSLNIKF
ncbi:SusC/RagA family TonB-linked outer membrane protein [Pedobacter glucosidilyticus]|uniref:SusC/RagA family TonB-linked outer membrane protein n=1 Tax=Pedobacter glucosidilyticus TaxID=1122941 RepID=UPI00041DE6B5|nr:TonB-dependent receptor [Pedobacter glucosidilyticus]